jgi:hypothetical protein
LRTCPWRFDGATLFGGAAKGYTDYPALPLVRAA